jgi:hypothetical protein
MSTTWRPTLLAWAPVKLAKIAPLVLGHDGCEPYGHGHRHHTPEAECESDHDMCKRTE